MKIRNFLQIIQKGNQRTTVEIRSRYLAKHPNNPLWIKTNLFLWLKDNRVSVEVLGIANYLELVRLIDLLTGCLKCTSRRQWKRKEVVIQYIHPKLSRKEILQLKKSAVFFCWTSSRKLWRKKVNFKEILKKTTCLLKSNRKSPSS